MPRVKEKDVIESIVIRAFETLKGDDEKSKNEILSEINKRLMSKVPSSLKNEADIAKKILNEGFLEVFNLFKDNDVYKEIFSKLPEASRYEMLLYAYNDIENMTIDQMVLLKELLGDLKSNLIYSDKEKKPFELISGTENALIEKIKKVPTSDENLRKLSISMKIILLEDLGINGKLRNRIINLLSLDEQVIIMKGKNVSSSLRYGIARKYLYAENSECSEIPNGIKKELLKDKKIELNYKRKILITETSLMLLNTLYRDRKISPEIKEVILARCNDIILTTENIDVRKISEEILVDLLKFYKFPQEKMENMIDNLSLDSISEVLETQDLAQETQNSVLGSLLYYECTELYDMVGDDSIKKKILERYENLINNSDICQLFEMYSETDNIVFQERILNNVERKIITEMFPENIDFSGRVVKREDSIYKSIKTTLKKDKESRRNKVLKNVFKMHLDGYESLKSKVESLIKEQRGSNAENGNIVFLESVLQIINYKMRRLELQNSREARRSSGIPRISINGAKPLEVNEAAAENYAIEQNDIKNDKYDKAFREFKAKESRKRAREEADCVAITGKSDYKGLGA